MTMITKQQLLFAMVFALSLSISTSAKTPLPIEQRNDVISESARNALKQYTAEIEEIERVAALRKKEAKERLLRALQATEQFEKEKDTRYHGMIGTYHGHKGILPYLCFQVPDGSNVFHQKTRDVLNGRRLPERPLYSFEARGHVVIPKDGKYHLETGRGYWKFQLNGVDYRLGWIKSKPYGSHADVHLKKGVYDILMTTGNNGGQLQRARVTIIDSQTNKPLPIFIYQSEIDEAFRIGRQTGREPVEVTGWSAKVNRISK